MRCWYGLTVLSLALLVPGQVLAEGDQLGKDGEPLQKKSDEDLLDADLDDLDDLDEDVPTKTQTEDKDGSTPKPTEQAIVVPPAEEKARIDAEVKAIGEKGDEVGKELFDELKTLIDQDRTKANAEIEKRLKDATDRLNNLQAQVETMRRSMDDGRDPSTRERDRERRDYRGDYGQPIDRDARDPRNQEPQLKWWQKLLLKALNGLQKGMANLAEKRTNALKAEADKLALSTDPRYRPYVDSEVRTALDNSSLGRLNNYDKRLNDLFLNNNRKKVTKTNPYEVPVRRTNKPFIPNKTAWKQPGIRLSTKDIGGKVEFLPREKDPVTGRTRIIVNMPLGMAPIRK